MTRTLGPIGAVRAAHRAYAVQDIAELRAAGPRTAYADTLYAAAVRRLGLFHVAYFGTRGKPGDRRRLRDVWRESRRIAGGRP